MAKDLLFEEMELSAYSFDGTGVLDVFEASGTRSGLISLARGTLIECADGPRPVENLRPGDLIQTMDNGLQPLAWVGRSRLPISTDNAPVCIAADFLENTRTLTVSPGLRVLLTGFEVELLFSELEVLAPAHALVNGTTITRAEEGTIEYFDLIFSRHEIIFAEGQPVESALPALAAQHAERAKSDRAFEALYPELSMDLGGDAADARLCLEPHEAMVAAAQLGLDTPVTPAPSAPETCVYAA